MTKLYVLVLALLSACSPMSYTHGIPNFAQVSPGIYRSGQITTQEGWNYLRQVVGPNVRIHVVKLNYSNEGSDELAVESGYDVRELPIQPQGDQDTWDDLKSAFTKPDMQTVASVEALLAQATVKDVWLVHCTHGQDRTGFIIGVHRVLHEHWTKQKAYEEMRTHHFHWELRGIHEAWEGFQP